MTLQSCWTLAAFSDSSVGRTLRAGDQPVARPLPTHRTTQTQKKRTQTSIPSVGLEPTIPAFKRGKTVHALDRVATVTGSKRGYCDRLRAREDSSCLRPRGHSDRRSRICDAEKS
jgi:hypothetical protein